MAWRIGHHPRRCRACDRFAPGLPDLIEFAAESDPVDRAVCGETTDDNSAPVFAALPVRWLREDERLPLLLRYPTAELPANQRMHFGILVDRLIDNLKKARLLQRREMFA
jgi:hypothetical protein